MVPTAAPQPLSPISRANRTHRKLAEDCDRHLLFVGILLYTLSPVGSQPSAPATVAPLPSSAPTVSPTVVLETCPAGNTRTTLRADGCACYFDTQERQADPAYCDSGCCVDSTCREAKECERGITLAFWSIIIICILCCCFCLCINTDKRGDAQVAPAEVARRSTWASPRPSPLSIGRAGQRPRQNQSLVSIELNRLARADEIRDEDPDDTVTTPPPYSVTDPTVPTGELPPSYDAAHDAVPAPPPAPLHDPDD
mmetsp:Transcript_6118/g.15625  ORF Transcript_6118/g.15625 Transcript_6118/m.15625 type:complete len:254 (-) Transcript_6118:160-921(-)